MSVLFQTLVTACGGFSCGAELVESVSEAKDRKLGKNYYLGAFADIGQAVGLSSLALRIFTAMKKGEVSARTELLCNVAPLVISPVFLAIAALKHGIYTDLQKSLHASLPALPKLPDMHGKLNVAIHFLAEHTTDIMRVATIVGIIALILLGQPLYAAAAFLAVGFHIAASNNLVPLDAQIFVETYGPAVSFAGDLLDGTVLDRLMTFFFEPIGFLPELNLALQRRLDAVFKKILFIQRPTLFECDALPPGRKDFSFEDILIILASKKEDFKFVPSHFTQEVSDNYPLEETQDFVPFEVLFNSFPWEKFGWLIFPKVRDDERFLAFLQSQLPEVGEIELKNDPMKYLKNLALAKNIQPNQYLAEYLRSEISTFIGVLKGKCFVEGDKHDIPLAQKNLYQCLPYLYKLSFPEEWKQIIEDRAPLHKQIEKLFDEDEKLKGQAYLLLTGTQKSWLDIQAYLEKNHQFNEKIAPLLTQDAQLRQKALNISEKCTKDKALNEAENKAENKALNEAIDLLIRLSVEGGGYCSEQLNRATKLLKKEILACGLGSDDPIQSLEMQIVQALGDVRERIFQSYYESGIKWLKWMSIITHNMHIERTVSSMLTLGFLPITLHERGEMSSAGFLFSEVMSAFTGGKFYQLYEQNWKDAFKKISLPALEEYLVYIQRNLTPEQRNIIKEKRACWEGYNSPEEMGEAFYRLVLCHLGVMELKKTKNGQAAKI